MFDEKSFEVFNVSGLDERMGAIREVIQPIFHEIGTDLVTDLEQEFDRPFYLHIAQHRRRTVHPPENTWAAVGEGKRGYKMAPHFQVGIWPEYVFLWLSMIDQPKEQKQLASKLLKNMPLLEQLPADFVISKDHTQPDYFPLAEAKPALERLAKVKKSEFQIGRILPRDSEIWSNPEAAATLMKDTYRLLMPIYDLLQ